jgi:VanZ family protein
MSIRSHERPAHTSMRLKFKKFWLIIGLGFVALVVFLSLTPDLPDTGVPEGMKIGHVVAYCWLMLWFAQVYRSATARYRLALTFCVMGIALEYLQGLTDYRGFEYSDMLINSLGVGLGLLLSYSRLQNGLTTLESMLLSRT